MSAARVGRPIRVVMAMPHPRHPGGITALVDSWEQAGLGGMVELAILPTSAMDASLPAKAAMAARAQGRLLRLLASSRRPDVLHLHASTGASLLRKLALGGCARLADVPYVAHLHSGGIDAWLARSPLHRALARRLVSGAAATIVLAERWRGTATGLGAGRIEVIPNGIARSERERLERVRGLRRSEPSRPATDGSPGPPVLLFYGRWGPVKGLDRLAAPLRRLGRDDYELRIYGNGDRAWLERALADLPGRVTISGWLGGERKLSELAGAAAVVSPSRAEGLPMAMIEARAAGATVIATTVGAVEEVLGDYPAAILVADGDAAALERALEQVLDGELDPEPASSAGLPERFRAEVAVERVSSLYRELLGR